MLHLFTCHGHIMPCLAELLLPLSTGSYVNLYQQSRSILSLPLIQERQLSASGERMCTILVNWAVKPQQKQTKDQVI